MSVLWRTRIDTTVYSAFSPIEMMTVYCMANCEVVVTALEPTDAYYKERYRFIGPDERSFALLLGGQPMAFMPLGSDTAEATRAVLYQLAEPELYRRRQLLENPRTLQPSAAAAWPFLPPDLAMKPCGHNACKHTLIDHACGRCRVCGCMDFL